MLHSSVSCCKCIPLAFVSMRAGRAKPQPPMSGGGADRCWRCGEEAQVTRCRCGRGEGESSGQPVRDGHCAGVDEAGASHPSSMDSRSEAGSSDASAGNRVSTGGARIRADGAEQPQASGCLGASADYRDPES
jgi:hypothetical protein